MVRIIINATLVLGLVGPAVSCQTPAEVQREEHAAAREDLAKAGEVAGRKIDTAREDLVAAERKFGEDVAKAQVGVVDAGNAAQRRISAADDEAARATASDRYAGFVDLTAESESAFDARAEGALVRLELDLDAASQRTVGSADAKLVVLLETAKATTASARKDLAVLRSKTGEVLDDGKVSVTMALTRVDVGVAINRAQRDSEAVFGQLAVLKI